MTTRPRLFGAVEARRRPGRETRTLRLTSFDPVAVHPLLAAVVALALTALITGAIEVLKHLAPVLSLGILYILAVLPASVAFGLVYGVVVSVLSMLAFNFFFLSPVYTLTMSDSRNWYALVVFVITAAVVSELATRTRRRAREATLLAEIATSLLEHGTVEDELEHISAEAARALQVERARIALGPDAGEGAELIAGGRRVGSIRLEGGRDDPSARRRLLPALASLLAVAVDREQLAREALEAEALRRADTIKTALLRAVSHDLRTPLMAISTSAGALAHAGLALDEADRAELLATVLAASARLDRLVGNLLDLSRLQAGAAPPEPELLDLEELVAAALEELGEAGVRVEVSLPAEPPSVRVDGQQIQRVLVNMVENALKYSPPEEPVRVQVAGGATEALVRVIDHGPGIPAGERQRIFEPFQRGSGGAGAAGAGLGLAIARGFAEANGGRIWVESLSQQGATFVLSLPAARPVAAAR